MRFRRYAWCVLGVNLLVVLWGAYVRASGSGAGCGRHWPLCRGEFIPTRPAAATLVEYAHRATSGLALLLVIVLVIWSRREFAEDHPARRWASWSLGLVIVEALIGAGLVLLSLVGANSSLARAGYLAAHLLNTFLLLGFLALTAYWAGAERPTLLPKVGAARATLTTGLLCLLLVGMSGAVTALGDTLFPASSLAEGLRADSSATAHLLIRLRVLHPAFALLTGLYLCVMVWAAGKQRPGAAETIWARTVIGLVLVQLSLGLLNLLLLAPVAIQLAHLLLADLLWIATLLFGVTALGLAPRESYMLPIMASANSEVRSSVAPSMRRWKS